MPAGAAGHNAAMAGQAGAVDVKQGKRNDYLFRINLLFQAYRLPNLTDWRDVGNRRVVAFQPASRPPC
jgi:hypothetical protein